MSYAYLTKAGIMHIVGERETAVNSFGQGEIVETEMENHGGYPVAFYDGKEEQIIVYSETEMKLEARGKLIAVLPKLAELYKKCLG